MIGAIFSIYLLLILIRTVVALYFINQIYVEVEKKFLDLYKRAINDDVRSVFIHNFYCLDYNVKNREVMIYILNIFKPLDIDEWLSDDLKHFLYEV